MQLIQLIMNIDLNLAERIVVSPLEMPMQLAKLALALADDVNTLPEEVQKLLIGLEVDKATKQHCQST